MDFYLHMGSENAALGLQPQRGEHNEETFVEGFGLYGAGGLIETGSAALAAIAVEGELRNAQNTAADIEYGAVHFALVVGENAQVDAFICAEAQGFVVVAGAESDKE